MNKKLLSIILVLAMTVGMLAVVPMTVSATVTDVWDGSVATAFAGGSGTENDPYKIANGAHLAYLAAESNKGNSFSGAYFILTNDIALNSGNAEDWEVTAPANMFTPIGVWNSGFAGCFDGKGHTISGMYQNGNGNMGLFGNIGGGAIIKNLAIVNTYVKSSAGESGALVGQSDRSSTNDILIENVYIEASVYGGNSSVGGVIGNLSNSQAGYTAGSLTMKQVTFVGCVEATNYVSGLIGDARNVIFDIDDCLVFADIKATSGQYAAGFVGRSNSSLTFVEKYDQVATNCILAGGSVTATKNTKYNRAFISSSGSTSKPLAEYCYNAISGLSTMRNADTTDDAPSADILQAELYGFYEEESAIDWEQLTEWARPEKDIARPKGIAEGFEIHPFRELTNGTGTEADPYKIGSAEELDILSELSMTNTFENTYFELTADIALTGENNHRPIGTWESAFGGIFDGKGHTISGMNIVKNGDALALFGVIQGGAVIKNLVLLDAHVESTNSGVVAALVGQTNRENDGDVTISNVFADAEIIGKGSEVGGIVANLSDSNTNYTAGTVNISNTVFSGSVTTTKNYCGGIVGNARNVTVNLTNCANYGTVSANGQYVGGLISGMANAYTVTNCISAGSVEAKDETLAAIVYSKDAKAEDAIRTITSTYYVTGTANDATANRVDEGATIIALDSKSVLIGESAVVIEGWAVRANDYIVPADILEYLPAADIIKFTITWKNHDGTLLAEELYEYGSLLTYKGDAPTKAEDDRYYYRHNGWMIGEAHIDLTKYIVTEDATLVADFYRERKPVDDTPDNDAPDDDTPDNNDTSSGEESTSSVDTSSTEGTEQEKSPEKPDNSDLPITPIIVISIVVIAVMAVAVTVTVMAIKSKNKKED